MEETKLSKTTSGKENALTDTNLLYHQCHTQLLKLNQHLSHQIITERNAKLNSIIPSIDALNQQITQIQESINHQTTQEESKNQKQSLLLQKQNLIKNIQSLSKKIQKYKKQLIALNIDHQELSHQFQENKRVLQQKEKQIGHPSNLTQKIQSTNYAPIQRRSTLPSLFSQKTQRLQTNRSQIYKVNNQKQSKWHKIDELFDKLSNLKFTDLGNALVEVAKRQNGTIKGVFRNFKTNQKLGQYAKSHQVHKQFERLLKTVKKQGHK